LNRHAKLGVRLHPGVDELEIIPAQPEEVHQLLGGRVAVELSIPVQVVIG